MHNFTLQKKGTVVASYKHHSSHALVLRHFIPHQKKIILFDRDIGKLEAYVRIEQRHRKYEKLHAGTLIAYHMRNVGHHRRMIEFDQIVDIPFRLAKQSILFLHHLLELCYYFLPLESHDNHAIFDLLIFLYQIDEASLTVATQKLFLFRLFAVLGMYPESMTFHNTQFYSWISCPLNELASANVSIEIERLLDIWLINCIKDHPMIESFKTTQFLKEARVL